MPKIDQHSTRGQHTALIREPGRTGEKNVLDASVSRRAIRAFQRLVIEYVSPEVLKPSSRRAKKSKPQQIDHLAACLARFGFAYPLVVDQNNQLIAGHAVWTAARQLQLREVPVVRRNDLNDDEVRALALALNKLSEMSTWDEDVLKIELSYLLSIENTLDFGVRELGFATPEIDRIVGLTLGANSDETLPPISPGALACSRLGDLWILGRHRLLCGDATLRDGYILLCGDEKAQLGLTDPPYNREGRDISTRAEHGTFMEGSGEMSSAEFTGFLSTTFGHLAQYSENGALVLAFMDWRHMREMLDAGESAFSELKNLIVWGKDVPALGSLWKSQHELVFAWKNGTAPHINNVELGRHGRNRGNLWLYPGANSSRDPALKWHPTPKNVPLLIDAMLDCTHRSGIVLDCFIGSGSTIVAAEQCERRCYGIELDPRYVDGAIKRWENLTGQKAVHAATGLTFEALLERRRREGDQGDHPAPRPGPGPSRASEAKSIIPTLHVRRRAQVA